MPLPDVLTPVTHLYASVRQCLQEKPLPWRKAVFTRLTGLSVAGMGSAEMTVLPFFLRSCSFCPTGTQAGERKRPLCPITGVPHRADTSQAEWHQPFRPAQSGRRTRSQEPATPRLGGAGPVPREPNEGKHARGRTEKDSCRVMVAYKNDACWQVLQRS